MWQNHGTLEVGLSCVEQQSEENPIIMSGSASNRYNIKF